MSDKIYLGMDTGSVSLNTVLISGEGVVLASDYRRTCGRIIETVKEAVSWAAAEVGKDKFAGVGTTGSGRQLTAALLGADLVKNEITAHTRAAIHCHPDARTILEIGGEDSKIVLLENGLPVDFAMNTLCAAGTGAFLDQLAGRLDIPVEKLGTMEAAAESETAISGRCTVFAESDIIYKQQTGHSLESIVKGLCRSLVRNYLSDTANGKEICPPVLFQGGVAANSGIVRAFEEELGCPVIRPEHYQVMGAYGAALLAKDVMEGEASRVRPLEVILKSDLCPRSFQCCECGNNCEIIQFREQGQSIGQIGGRCDRWKEKTTVS